MVTLTNRMKGEEIVMGQYSCARSHYDKDVQTTRGLPDSRRRTVVRRDSAVRGFTIAGAHPVEWIVAITVVLTLALASVWWSIGPDPDLTTGNSQAIATR